MVPYDVLRSLPKVSLHDHLDGALRPATVVELADEIGWTLPTSDPAALGDWFFEAASSGSLPRYLETFAHTVAVLQTEAALRRVAWEYVADMVADGVVYAEVRWAPELNTAGGLTLEAAVEAVADGLAAGMADAAAAGHPVVVRQLLASMRHGTPSTRTAELVLRYRDAGVAGFDIAGEEDGYPPSRFREAFDLVRWGNGHSTIHAGEAFGPASIAEAVHLCGANRLGHGVRIVDDVWVEDGKTRLGRLAAYVRDQRIPLEMCPTSNVQTGVCASVAEHPFGRLAELGFLVTVNCDNRLQSRTTLTDEFAALADAFGYGLADVERFTVDAARAAFWGHDHREELIRTTITPAYDRARAAGDGATIGLSRAV